ncbi:DNA repair protein RAD51-like protein, partial [Stegodyphus mimosarum]
MSRELTTFPFSQNTRFKLLNSGFVTVDDLRDFKPSELSKETQLTVQEAMDVLDLVFPKPSHSKSTIESKSCSALNMLLEEKDLPPITTSCKLLDSILGGGISVRKVTEICGCPGSGKTQL